MSFQALLINSTPFAAEKFVLATPDGQEGVLVLVTATLDLRGHGDVLRPAETQRPAPLVDSFHGDPATSSPRTESQLTLEKPAVDVLVLGQAHAPHGRPVSEMHVGVRVGNWTKVIRVSGDRFWRRRPFGASPSSPRPFDCMPLIYERAFGGTTADVSWRPNPVGVGFSNARPADAAIDTELPNFELPRQVMTAQADRVAAAAFGPIGRAWAPRSSFAGTYDAAWKANRWPILPADFNPGYNNAAPPDQQLARMDGGEHFILVGMHPAGDLRGTLPRDRVAIEYVYPRERLLVQARLDTLVFEPDESLVTLTWRAAIVTRRSRGSLREIRIAARASA